MAHLTRRVTQIAHRWVGIAAPRSRCAAVPPLPKGTTGHAEPAHREALFVGLLPLQRSAILATAMWKQRRASVGIPCSRYTWVPWRRPQRRPSHPRNVGTSRLWLQSPFEGLDAVAEAGVQWRVGWSGQNGSAGVVCGVRSLGVRESLTCSTFQPLLEPHMAVHAVIQTALPAPAITSFRATLDRLPPHTAPLHAA